MFWLFAMIATFGVGGASLFATLNRMGANLEKVFRTAPDLAPAQFAEGAYGKVTGVVSASGVVAPGVDVPSALYELIVHEATYDRQGTAWRLAHTELVGGAFSISVGDAVVHLDAREIYVLSAPAHDAERDLRRNPRQRHAQSRVRYVPVGATVSVVGTLTREVDADPSAQNDYREVATRYRLIGKRKQPIVIAVLEQKRIASRATDLSS